MKLNIQIKNIIIEIICIVYILLFVYAAVSKLMDFSNFQVQIAQSPLLTAYAGFISITVILLELLIALLLSIAKTRVIGLYISFTLMLLFSIYIYLILNYSPFVPCSCGGILENMGWTEHLAFNLVFTLLATIALYFSYNSEKQKHFYFPIRMSVLLLLSIIFMYGLFLSSENIVHQKNNFVRRYPPFPTQRIAVKNLKFDSYYLAGQGQGKLFLGNRTAPALITELDTTFKMISYPIQIKDTLFRFRNVKLRVQPPYFYLFDGTVPCIFKGSLHTKKAILQSQSSPGFTKAEIVDTNTFIIRTLNSTRENLLAIVKLHDGQVKNAPKLLQKQVDGLFDTDGTLQYSPEEKKFVYLYYYRNQYIVTDASLHLLHRGNTIDTTTRAKIKVQYILKRKEKKFSAPPFLVNRMSTLHRNLLFVNSTLPGRYDEAKMWKNAHIIDVYDILKKSYLMSFPLYKIDGQRLDSFIVTDTHLFAHMGNNIVLYKLNTSLKDNYIH
jgi:hypothetical protein